jgi:hypothetical protein
VNELSASVTDAIWADEFPWLPEAPLDRRSEGFIARGEGFPHHRLPPFLTDKKAPE